ncbi:helix-turn-helix domain-containing protein [Providencia stuartii]|uniref:helix-turn-helix domain-containing protein n=1 Tax=Providencia stuartii TaxID=588 RepID=UPI0024AB316C|nr:helix-turn-helix transcriptional regulator [Providencia stuartii]MCX3072557.1 helix-turn-helix transcriptional regulator [Providencia stuartii]
MKMDTKEKSTCFHTICRLLLKELRQEKNVQQAHISQLLSRSPSSWSKVETGETPLSLDHLLTACSACQVWPSQLFITAQNYMSLLTQYDWYVAAHGTPLEKEADLLSLYADEYYSSNLQQYRMYQVLLTPWPFPGTFAPLDVFRWAIDPSFRNANRNTTIQTMP